MNEKRKYVVNIVAVKPVFTNRDMFSECSDVEAAKTDALAQFDTYHPDAKDRTVKSVTPYSEYLKRLDEMDEMNRFMNS